MSHLLFKVIGFLVVVGAIFAAGVVVGGSFATGSAEDSQRARIERCLPITTAGELHACLSKESR